MSKPRSARDMAQEVVDEFNVLLRNREFERLVAMLEADRLATAEMVREACAAVGELQLASDITRDARSAVRLMVH